MISVEQATSYAKKRLDIAAGLERVVRAGIDVHISSLTPKDEQGASAGRTISVGTEMYPQQDMQPYFIGPAGLHRASETSIELTLRQLALDNALGSGGTADEGDVTGLIEEHYSPHPFIHSQNARRRLREQQPGIWV